MQNTYKYLGGSIATFFKFFSKQTESEEDILNQVKLKPHNQETYDNLLEMLKRENRVACVQPTGTGKSYIALEFIEDHTDKQVLLLAPTDIILNQFKETVEEIFHKDANEAIMKNTTTAKYLDLSLKGFQYIFDVKWDVIIMDEFHRTGASVWNQFIDKLISMNPDAKLIGLSATPIRFLDDYRNMGEEIFHGNYACHYNVNDAWKRGILPIPKYVLTDYRITEGTEDYIRNRYPYATTKERIDWIVKQYLENGGNIHQILKEHLPNKNGKYIVFCSDSAHIKKMRPVVKGWLEPFNPKIHMYTTLSMDDEPDAGLLAFKNDNSESIRLLFCVERLNEGLHLSNLDGIFMLRPTTSPIIYLQQMGRVLNAGSTKQVVIFDLVNNFSEYKRTVLRYRDMTDEEIENLSPKERAEYNSYKEGKYDEFLKFDFVQNSNNICDLFDKLDRQLNEMYKLEKEKEKKKIRETKYLQMINMTLDYYRLHKKWPSRSSMYGSNLIGKWYFKQKYLYHHDLLEKWKISLLKENHISLEYVLPDIEESWYFHYDLLDEFVEVYQRLPKLREEYKNVNLGYWLKSQKRSYKRGILSDEKIKLLESLGVNFHSGLNEQWDEFFNTFSEYFKTFNVIPTVTTKYKDIDMGSWFRRQLIKYGGGKLDDSQANMFKEMGIDLDLLYKKYIEKKEKTSRNNHKRNNDWNYRFELLNKFIVLNHREPVSNETFENVNLGAWLYHQRRLYKNNSLRKDRQDKLESIGVVFDDNKKE